MQVARRPHRSPRPAALAAATAVGLFALAALSTAPVRAQAAAPAAAAAANAPHIGVVNVNAVRSKIQELADFRGQVQNQQNLIDASRKGHEAQLTDMQNRLRNLKPDSDAFNDLVVQLDEKRAQFNVSDQLLQASLLRMVNTKQKHLYDEIIAVVGDLAKQRGLDLVMVDNDVQIPMVPQEMNPEQLNNLLAQKLILFVSDRVNLTDEVATRLDADYKAHGGAGGAAAPAPAH